MATLAEIRAQVQPKPQPAQPTEAELKAVVAKQYAQQIPAARAGRRLAELVNYIAPQKTPEEKLAALKEKQARDRALMPHFNEERARIVDKPVKMESRPPWARKHKPLRNKATSSLFSAPKFGSPKFKTPKF